MEALEVNFRPNLPSGESPVSLEDLIVQVIDELQKTDKNTQLIENLMQQTFALRQQELVQGKPHASIFFERWPALKMQSQVRTES